MWKTTFKKFKGIWSAFLVSKVWFKIKYFCRPRSDFWLVFCFGYFFWKIYIIWWVICYSRDVWYLSIIDKSSERVTGIKKFRNIHWKTPDLAFRSVTLLKRDSNTYCKVFKGAFLGLRQVLASESPSKLMNNAFYLILKGLFVLKIFKFLSWLFGHVEKQPDLKGKVNFKIYDITTWSPNNSDTHINLNFKE